MSAKINLANLDVLVVIDKSGSMGMNNDTPSGASRWKYSEEVILSLVTEIGKHDDNGLDIIFFNNSHKLEEGVKPEAFPGIWRTHTPGGGTTLAPALKTALDLAGKRWKEKQQFIICLTDGSPSDPKDVEKVIIAAANSMEKDEQCAILFVQVGRDGDAKAFLANLDDGLQAAGAKFDIVDTDDVDTVGGKPLQELVDKAFND